MLSYMDVHVTYTLPVLVVLILITRPFINRFEIFKIIFHCVLALVYSTPWDNYIVFNGAWKYPENRVWAVIGYVPVEEYLFFIVQTGMTSLWTVLCVRWSLPCLNFNYHKTSYEIIRWIPLMVLVAATVFGYRIAVPDQHTFYLGSILCWVCPVIAFLWYGAGNFFVKNIKPSFVAIAVPSLYLCWVDQIALKNGIWHISEKTSINVFVTPHLPLEEVFFFFSVNMLIVLGINSFDKARGLMETYPSQYPERFSMSLKFIKQMFWAFVTPEYNMPYIVTEDVRISTEIIKVASKSFNTAGFLFSTGVRLDLTILYAFCRVTDDMIDETKDIKQKKRKLEIIGDFLDDLFADRKSDYEIYAKHRKVKINWSKYKSELTDVELSSFRAISRIAFYLPRKPFYELLAGYKWDMDGRFVKNEDDLLLYSSYVAGSVGALCVYVITYRCGDHECSLAEKFDHVIEKARQMGCVLQLVNIARDIVTDSKTLGRCYVPHDYMDDVDEELKILCEHKSPRSLGEAKLKKYSLKLIQLANKNQSESVAAIDKLPKETRGSILAATEIYRGISFKIQSNPNYPTRASLSKWNKLWIVFHSVYIKSFN